MQKTIGLTLLCSDLIYKLESAAYTGMNLKNNSNMVVKIKAMESSTLYNNNYMAEILYMLMVRECILEIRSNSVTFMIK